MQGKACELFLLVVVLVLVLGFSGFLDYEHEDDDENEPNPTFSGFRASLQPKGCAPMPRWSSGAVGLSSCALSAGER